MCLEIERKVTGAACSPVFPPHIQRKASTNQRPGIRLWPYKDLYVCPGGAGEATAATDGGVPIPKQVNIS